MLRSIAQQCVSKHLGLPRPSRRASRSSGRGRVIPFPRCIRIRVFVHALRKFCLKRTGGISFLPPLKKGRRSAERRTSGTRILKEMRARSFATARLSALLRGYALRSFDPNSAWAALPGIAGCKREDPLRRQCSRHPAVRSRAGRDDAQTPCKPRATNSARRNRSRSVSRCHRPMSLTTSEMALFLAYLGL